MPLAIGNTSAGCSVARQTISEGLVRVQGWVRAIRRHRRTVFVDIFDGRAAGKCGGAVQAVFSAENLPPQIAVGCAVSVEGTWSTRQSKAPLGTMPYTKQEPVDCAAGSDSYNLSTDSLCAAAEEIHVKKAVVHGPCDNQMPVQSANYASPIGQDALRLMPHLRVRNPEFCRRLMLRAQMFAALRSFLAREQCWEVHPPALTTSNCEQYGGSQDNQTKSANTQNSTFTGFAATKRLTQGPCTLALSTVGTRWKDAVLSTSAQLHLEALACGGLGRVYSLGRVWRGEPHNTPRHLSEFHMLEVEVCFVDALSDMMALCARTIAAAVSGFELRLSVEERKRAAVLLRGNLPLRMLCVEEVFLALQDLPRDQSSLYVEDETQELEKSFECTDAAHGFAAVSHADAAAAIGLGKDAVLPAYAERRLAERLGPVFIYGYPAHAKPFYTRRAADSCGGDVSESFDLILPGAMSEVAGGSMREHRLETLRSAMSREQEASICERASQSDYNSDDSRCRADPPSNDSRQGQQARGAAEARSTAETNVAQTFGNSDQQGLQWYADLARWGAVPHGGFGVGVDRLLAFVLGAENVRDVVAFPRDTRSAIRC